MRTFEANGLRLSWKAAARAAMLLIVAGQLLSSCANTAVGEATTKVARTVSRSSTRTAANATARKAVHSLPASGPEALGISGQWKLILDSQFGKSRLQGKLWRPGWFGTGVTGPINSHESACYSSRNLGFPDNGGVKLMLTGASSRCGGATRPYTGALISTNPKDGRASGGFQYRYGLLETKVYLPSYGGELANWPVLMTLGQTWPKDGEDDLLEGIGGRGCFTWHSPGYAYGNALGGCDADLKPGWHILAVNWKPGSVTWYYDGKVVDRITKGVTSAFMYLVLANTSSAIRAWVSRPAVMRVNWVRVWQPANPPASAHYAYSF